MSRPPDTCVTAPQWTGTRSRSARRWTTMRLYVLMLALPAAFFLVFFVWPVLRVIARSFLEPSVGLSNYRTIVHQAPFLSVLAQTFAIAASVTAICLLLAYPLAFFISRQRGFVVKLATGLIMLPLWTSVVIRSYAWMVLFQRDGMVNQVLLKTGIVDAPVRILQTVIAVEVGMVYVLLPFMVLPILAAMRNVDLNLLQMGRVLGAPPLRLFLRVYVPLTASGVTAGVTLVFITALGFYVTPALLGGSKGTMAAVLIADQASTYFNWPLASALATVLMFATIAVYFTYHRLTRISPARLFQ
ncbi:ABC transporter permease [Caballeronia sp. LZ035]|uniref:ABC transporter permease n=1 Tax=Caballeronia sp. LZ035 TaxID=3038568 RepID=UPI00285E2068|nr:ABC transporter permease [Caballeronia sp. LZ035]MDR5758950.1 ABC transporter permease [Caballeronia sp. LZ035]